MKALRFKRKGSLDELHVSELDVPTPGEGEVLVEVRASSINPSDVKNVLGKIAQTVLPRTPGRDYAGVVVKGSDSLIGKEVFGTGGDLGITRDGTHAEYVVVPSEALVQKPPSFSFEQAAASALRYVTAWYALAVNAELKAGETILILGVNGAVGGAAARIASIKGARVMGTVRGQENRASVQDLPVNDCIDLDNESLPNAVSSLTSGHGADVILDLVGGPMFEPSLRSLAHRGRYVVLSNAGESRVSFDLLDFYRNEGRIFGADTVMLSNKETANILQRLFPEMELGLLPAPQLETCRLEGAVEGYRRVESETAKKKIVIVNGH
jgi:NADPH2:quinone reductase